LCINNKKNEIYTKLGFGATLLASGVSWALVFYAKNQINDRGRGFHVVNDAVLQQIIREVDQNAGCRISIERIEQIIRETHPVRDFGDGSCSICLDALRERGTISVIPGCHHVFCTQCLEQHANTDIRDNDFDFVHRRAEDATCPQCRGPLNGRQSFDLEN